jgi:hypothetical protein
MRQLALRWLDAAIDVGGVTGARMLGRKASLGSEAFAGVRDPVLALLADDSIDGPPMRVALGEALAAATPTVGTRLLARRAVRAVVRDGALPRVVDPLVSLADDGALRADLAAAPAAQASPAPRPDGPIVRSDADRGAIAVSDAALLPGGRVLVALGEAGARVVGLDGRTVARFLEPAHAIVLSDHGDRALLLAPRGAPVWRVARVDLGRRSIRPWRDVRIDAFAPDFDGGTWMVATADALHAIDVIDEEWRALSSIAEEGAAIRAIARDASSVSVLRARSGSALEIWTHDVAGLVLRRRRAIEAPGGGRLRSHGTPSSWGGLAAIIETSEGCSLRVDDGSWREVRPLADASATLGAVHADHRIELVERREPGALALSFVRPFESERPLEVVLGGATRARARRCSEDRVLAFDDRGRLLLLSLARRSVLHEWRLA